MAARHANVNAMDILRSDDIEWQLWRALTRLTPMNGNASTS